MKKNYTFKYILVTAILLLAFCLPISMMGQTTVSFDGGNTTWTVPCGVTSVTVKAWGAGGGAGGSTKNNEGGSGGGGGAYTTRVLAVAPGNVITYQVGVSGGGGDGVNGLSGTPSVVTFGAFTLTAGGGTGGAADKGTIGSGGTASGGTTNTSGSNGVIGTASGGDGGNAANTAGGGGTGGAGVVNGDGGVGNTPGGGGGGGERNGGTNGIGGDGGNGRVQFIYTPSAQEINVTGNSITIVDGDLTPSVTDNTSFGTGNIINKTFVIENTGGTNLTIGAITFSGTHAGDFSVTTPPSATVAPCGSTSFVVTFTRVAAGVRTATIRIANNDSDENPYDFALTATGVAAGPEIDIFGNGVAIVDGDTTPSVADFTDFNGQGSREFSVFNNGTSVLTLSGSPRVSITGTDAASFFVISNPDPTVAAGATTVFTIGFSPSTLGVKNATIVIANDDTNENPYDFAISATATEREIDIRGDVTSIPSGNVTFSTTNLTDFRQVIIGSSWTNTFVIHNTGSLPLTLPATSVSSNNAKFTIIQPAAVIIPGNSSYEFYVSYTPTTAVTDTATITVLNNDADESVYTFNIRGTGLVGTVLVQPGCLGGSAPKCAAASNGSFDSGSAGWTVSNWTYDGSGGNPGGAMRFDGSGSSPTGYIRQSLTGLTSTSTSVLISFDIRIAYNGCNPDFKYIDLGVRFGGVEYLVITRQVPGTVEAPLNLYNGGILVATSSSIFAGKEGGGGCDNALWYKVYLQVPKAAGVTAGDLEFYADENNGKFANQLKMYIDNITATADAGTCGFVWLRADAGTSTTTDATGLARWDDQVLVDGGSAAEVATFPRQDDPARRPVYYTNVMNGNPGIYFDGVNDRLGSTAEKYSSVTSIIVFKPSGTINTASSASTLIGSNITKVATDVSGIMLGNLSAILTNETYGIIRGTGASGWATGVAAGPINALANMINVYPNATIPATDWVPTKNGSVGIAINGGSGYSQWAGQNYSLGASPDVTSTTFSRFYQGYIMEVLNYPSSFTALDRTKVESYLATKYGISLGKDYRAGFGAITYAIAGGFDQRIFGIGREDCMSFHQRISSCQSDTAESMLTIGYNGLISASNSSTSGNNLPNNAYVMIGDNNGARSSWVTTGAPVAEISEATRINRAFKLKVTGSPTSNIRFRLDGTKLPAVAANERVAMVIAGTLSDIPLATFTGSINKIIPMTKAGTNWVINVDVSGYSTAYFTFIRYKDCYTDLVCLGTTKTWSAGAWAPSAPTVNDAVLINSNYSTAASGNFTCCKLTVNATLTISSGSLVQVQSNIVNNASIVIQNNGSLMQYQDNAINSGMGTLTVTRAAQPMYRGDYTYWSAPVVGYDISNIPTNSGRRYSWSPSSNNWAFASGIMQSGKGYIVMTNNTNLTTATTTTINFTGSLFNGRINTDVYTSNDNYNLLGNPYPSALNADDFIIENHTAGRTTGGLYFWTHNTRIDEFNTRLAGSFSQSDYAVYTLAGGTAPASSSTGVYDANGSLITYGGNISAPNGYIAAGQAFFVEAVVSSKATFKNCMRTTSAGLNNNFYRTEESQITSKNRLWLDLINESGSFKQILFGYFDGADDDLDGLYDAKVNNGNNNVSLYSILDDKKSKKKVKLSVQGKSNNFKDTDEIPLGVQISKGASVKNTISLSKYEGLFEDQDVFIEDKLTETIHDLKLSNYTFEVQDGDTDERFVLLFRDKTLTSETEFAYKTTTVLLKDQNVMITSNNKIKDVMIYDVLGRLLYEKKEISSLEHTVSNVNKENSLHIVVVYLENGQKEITKVVY